MFAAARNRVKFAKTIYFGVQGRYKIALKRLVISACYVTQHIRAYLYCFHSRRANICKIKFLRGYIYYYYFSLRCLVKIPQREKQTDGRTDRHLYDN